MDNYGCGARTNEGKGERPVDYKKPCRLNALSVTHPVDYMFGLQTPCRRYARSVKHTVDYRPGFQTPCRLYDAGFKHRVDYTHWGSVTLSTSCRLHLTPTAIPVVYLSTTRLGFKLTVDSLSTTRTNFIKKLNQNITHLTLHPPPARHQATIHPLTPQKVLHCSCPAFAKMAQTRT